MVCEKVKIASLISERSNYRHKNILDHNYKKTNQTLSHHKPCYKLLTRVDLKKLVLFP